MKTKLGIIQFWLIYFAASFFKVLGKVNVKYLNIPGKHRGQHKMPSRAACLRPWAKLTTLFAECKCFDYIPPFANNWMRKCWTMWVESVWQKRFYWWSWSKQFDQNQNLFEFVQKKHQPNAIYCKMTEHERWTKYFATCNIIECFSELIRIAQSYFSVMGHYTNVVRFFYANVERGTYDA